MVPIERSKAEIERILIRYGATAFAYAWEAQQVNIGFRLKGRAIKLSLTFPSANDPQFARSPTGRTRAQTVRRDAYDQALRQQWRALALILKAKLEAAETGITTVEREFLADTLLPSGETFGQWAEDQVAQIYETGRMPRLVIELTGIKSAEDERHEIITGISRP